MSIRRLAVIIGCGALVASCTAQPAESAETQEIVDNLVKSGFPGDDIQIVDGAVYVGHDARVSLAASREMLAAGDPGQEQYRTTNLVGGSIIKICVNGSTFTGVFSQALDQAIQNYNAQSLTFSMARTPASGCSFTINGVIAPGVVGGSSGFPSGGQPFGTINIGDGLSTFALSTVTHVITHELGHTIGFRHSDFFNRAISCGGASVNEGDAGIGAILVPGTPSDATVGGSIMNSCFRTVEPGAFTGTDVTALHALYGRPGPTVDFNIAFQANTTVLWVVGPGGPGPTGLGMMPGTSPSITRLVGGGWEAAFQANTGNLWVTGTAGTADTGLGMMAGTSPSIAALSSGGYEVAFQANTSDLWVTGNAGTADTGLGMLTTTSPSITGLIGGGWEAAFQANTTNLWVTGNAGTADTGLGMMRGTSPSISRLVTGGYEVAFQANTSNLWVTGNAGTADTGLGMATTTSPSITGLAGGGWEAAFQANTTNLWVTGNAGTADRGLGMAANTSPSITARPGGGFDLVFQANTTNLWTAGSTGTGDLGLGMATRTSPSTN